MESLIGVGPCQSRIFLDLRFVSSLRLASDPSQSSIVLDLSFAVLMFVSGLGLASDPCQRCGDIHLNPGPIKFPCKECGKSVRNNQNAMLCSECGLCIHAKCLNISVDIDF